MTFEFAYFAKEFFVEEFTPPKIQSVYFSSILVDYQAADENILIHVEKSPYYINIVNNKPENIYNSTTGVYVNYKDFVEYLKINKFEKITPELLLLVNLIYVASKEINFIFQTPLTFDKSIYNETILEDFLDN